MEVAPVGPADLWARLLCPVCSARLSEGSWNESAVTCAACGGSFPRYGYIVDLRVQENSSCWTDTLAMSEDQLVRRLVELGSTARLEELIQAYSDAHNLVSNGAQDDVSYMLGADKREHWTVEWMYWALGRYHGEVGRERALDAGCGSGGSIGHLAARHASVAGIDPDLPALFVASRRCRDKSISDRVLLVAAGLEQQVFAAGTFDAIKCTDVIEHVRDPAQCASELVAATAADGAIYVLTPNKWNFYMPEPHVKLWGIHLLPRSLADRYSMRKIGIPYSTVSTLLSLGTLLRTMRSAGGVDVTPVPIEDKYLNPGTARGRLLKRLAGMPPARWVSTAVRPLQPVLEVVVGHGS